MIGYTQSKEDINQVPQKLVSSSAYNVSQIAQDTLALVLPLSIPGYDSTHISIMTIAEINLRWYVQGMQHIFDRDSHILKAGQPKRSIPSKRRIDLTEIA